MSQTQTHSPNPAGKNSGLIQYSSASEFRHQPGKRKREFFPASDSPVIIQSACAARARSTRRLLRKPGAKVTCSIRSDMAAPVDVCSRVVLRRCALTNRQSHKRRVSGGVLCHAVALAMPKPLVKLEKVDV